MQSSSPYPQVLLTNAVIKRKGIAYKDTLIHHHGCPPGHARYYIAAIHTVTPPDMHTADNVLPHAPLACADSLSL
ncbi:hypothetical protein KSX_04660 [Ktedonospora formicarum]|uniref:Uncharacterized protein n=1 Tax=Ktedonospora formicarum TaxID=2778364 RepID=A0A8J3HXB6_9CHLR|nr:hypothetical protein KSX_04660 [Ktedonospora formicarum]